MHKRRNSLTSAWCARQLATLTSRAMCVCAYSANTDSPHTNTQTLRHPARGWRVHAHSIIITIIILCVCVRVRSCNCDNFVQSDSARRARTNLYQKPRCPPRGPRHAHTTPATRFCWALARARTSSPKQYAQHLRPDRRRMIERRTRAPIVNADAVRRAALWCCELMLFIFIRGARARCVCVLCLCVCRAAAN